MAWVSPDGRLDRTRRARDIAAGLDVIGIAGFAAAMALLPMTLVSGLAISPVSRRNLVRGPVIVAALTCLIASHLIAWIMVGVSVVLVLMTVIDRTLRARPSH